MGSTLFLGRNKAQILFKRKVKQNSGQAYRSTLRQSGKRHRP